MYVVQQHNEYALCSANGMITAFPTEFPSIHFTLSHSTIFLLVESTTAKLHDIIFDADVFSLFPKSHVSIVQLWWFHFFFFVVVCYSFILSVQNSHVRAACSEQNDKFCTLCVSNFLINSNWTQWWSTMELLCYCYCVDCVCVFECM